MSAPELSYLFQPEICALATESPSLSGTRHPVSKEPTVSTGSQYLTVSECRLVLSDFFNYRTDPEYGSAGKSTECASLIT